jgi:serine/threonine-protein kinase
MPVALDPPDLRDSPYEVVNAIGSGAVATVWKARSRDGERTVAIKVLRAEAMRREVVQRLAQEADILRTLDHPCIVKVYGAGTAKDGSPYLVMEWIDGKSLRSKLAECPLLSVELALTILEQICSALDAAHSKDVVHRDLKPENVLLSGQGLSQVKVVDFGMAKILRNDVPALTVGSKIFGTPEYMAPERAQGRPLTGKSDIYAVGVMAYEMLAGRRPFSGKSAMDIMVRHVFDEPPPLPEVGAALRRAVFTALSKKANDRPTPAEFVQELAQAVSGEDLGLRGQPTTTG